jgi:conjugal transfer pilus assembly protein TraW
VKGADSHALLELAAECAAEREADIPEFALRLAQNLAGSAGLLALALALAAPVWPASAWSRDLGAIGPVYEIAEPDMIKEIKARLQAKQAAGELDQLETEARRRIQARIETPLPVAGLSRATAARSFHFDPSVRFDEPVLDQKGRVVIPAGMLANPLAVVSLPATLLFFDGRDPAQVALANAELMRATGPINLILVGGSPSSLMRQWQRPVYFDQGGAMVRRFGITTVPARVTQDGQLLRIQEVPAQ